MEQSAALLFLVSKETREIGVYGPVGLETTRMLCVGYVAPLAPLSQGSQESYGCRAQERGQPQLASLVTLKEHMLGVRSSYPNKKKRP